jgi:membrane-associated phospholipid phosphatase
MLRLVSSEPPSFLTQVRRPATVAAAASALILIALGVRYAGESSGRWLDETALALFRAWMPMRRGAARWLIELADPLPLVVLVALLAGACLVLGRWRLAVLAVVGPAMTGVATTVLKELIGRTKNGDLAYPSGHGGAATALALVAGLLLVSLLRVRLWAAVSIVTGLTVAVGGGMAVAMTLTNYHYLTDTLGGFCAAVSVVLGVALLLERRAVLPRPEHA